MPRRYALNGCAGLVEQRKNRKTGTLVGLYHAEQAGLDSDPEYPWATVCEEHGNLVVHPTLTFARAALSYPDWCEDCQPALGLKRHDS